MGTYLRTFCILTFSALAFPCFVKAQSFEQLDSLTLFYLEQGEMEKALTYAQKTIRAANAAGTDSLIAKSNNMLGDIYMEVGDYESAESAYRNALVKTPKNSEMFSLISTNLGTLFFYKGQYEKAEPFFSGALDLDLKRLGDKHEDYATALNNLATLYIVMGRYEQAEPLYVQARNIFGKEHPNYASSTNNLAQLYQKTERYEQAEPLYVEAKEILEKLLGKEHPNYGSLLNNMALLYSSMNQPNKAEPLFLESLKIIAKTLGKKHYTYARTLNNLAQLYGDLNNFAKAEETYKEVLNITERATGKQSPDYGNAKMNLGYLYKKQKYFDKATSCTKEASDIYLNSLGNKHPDYAFVLNNLSDIYIARGNLDSALFYCKKSFEANTNQDTVDLSALQNVAYISPQNATNSMSTLLRIYQIQFEQSKDIKHLQKQYDLCKTASLLGENARKDFVLESTKMRWQKGILFFCYKAIETAVQLNKGEITADAFFFAEQNKSILFTDALKSDRALHLGDLPDSLALKELSLDEQMSDLKQKELKAKTPEQKSAINSQINEVNSKIIEFKSLIKDKYPKYHRLKYEQINVSAKEIQELLNEVSLFLEYFIADSLLYVFVISKREINLFQLPISHAELQNNTHRLRTALSDYEQINNQPEENLKNYTESAFLAYKQLLEPVLSLPMAANKKDLIIVADGEIGHLPFEVFLTEKITDDKVLFNQLPYLLRDYNIYYNYSATLWRDNISHKNKPNNGKMFAFAAAYRNNSSNDTNLLNRSNRAPYITALRNTLADLPAAKNEVETLSENFEGEFLFNDQANETYFKQYVSDYAIVHLAMHGILNKRLPILSSLAFTENNDSINDNFLEAWEIAKLSINADLVVLSACETGYGNFEQGEGVLSLARSFMYAGTPSLLVSMWEVNDASTADIMEFFYTGLSSGKDKASALRDAKLNYLSKAKGTSAHPAFWSPLILLGNNSPIPLKTKNQSNWFVWGAIVSALLLAIVIALKARKPN